MLFFSSPNSLVIWRLPGENTSCWQLSVFPLCLGFFDLLARKIRETDIGHLISLDKEIGKKQKKHKNKTT